MLFDIYMIFLTAFAIFGLFCLIEQIVMAVKYSSSPKSVTILNYDAAFSTYDSIRYIHNTLYNNEILVVSENPATVCPLATTVSQAELLKYITNALFTKN